VADKTDPSTTIDVLYRGQVPDQVKVGREVVVTGALEGGVFVARPDSLVTLCPSKFTDKQAGADT
jgi:cytochrome c-type biogenesis protein CcmE